MTTTDIRLAAGPHVRPAGHREPMARGGRADARWPEGHPRRRRILLVLCLSLLIVVIDNTILNTALPTLARVLHAGTSSLQWITDAYTLCFAALLIPAGALGDRFGRQALPDRGAGRLRAGQCGGGVRVRHRPADRRAGRDGPRRHLRHAGDPVDPEHGVPAQGARAGHRRLVGRGRRGRRDRPYPRRPTAGPLLVGDVFLINVPLVAAALAGVVRCVPETAEPGRARFDIPGVVLVAGALFAIVDAIIEAPDRGWITPATLGMAAAGVARLAAFVWWELRIADPLIDLRVFTSRAFSTAAGAVTVIFFALFGSLFVLTQYLQLVHGYSPLSAGLRALPFALAMAAVSPVSPLTLARPPRRPRDHAGGDGAAGPGPAGPVDRGRAHRLPSGRAGRRDHGRGHGPGDGPGQYGHHDHGAGPPRGSAVSRTPSVRSAGPSAWRSSAACPPPSTAPAWAAP